MVAIPSNALRLRQVNTVAVAFAVSSHLDLGLIA